MKITVNVPTYLLKDLKAVKAAMGFRSIREALESLILAADWNMLQHVVAKIKARQLHLVVAKRGDHKRVRVRHEALSGAVDAAIGPASDATTGTWARWKDRLRTRG